MNKTLMRPIQKINHSNKFSENLKKLKNNPVNMLKLKKKFQRFHFVGYTWLSLILIVCTSCLKASEKESH